MCGGDDISLIVINWKKRKRPLRPSLSHTHKTLSNYFDNFITLKKQ